MKIIFVSPNYKPAHKYTISSYNRIFKSVSGNETYFLKDCSNYSSNNLPSDCKPISFKGIDKKTKYLYFFVSPSTQNLRLIKKIKKQNPVSKFVYLYHEPLTNLKTITKDYGLKLRSIILYFGLLFFNGPRLVRKFDYIIMPSQNSLNLYEKKRKNLKIAHGMQHLLFDKPVVVDLKREYVSYIGTVAMNHGFNNFVEFALSNNLPKNINFLIATSSNVDEEICKRLKETLKERIEIKQGNFLSDEEMAIAYSKTAVLWLGYTNSAQSGVLPMSLSFGTPSVFSNIAAFNEFLNDKIEGRLIDIDNKTEIENAMTDIIENFDKYSLNCLQKFDDNFWFKTQSPFILDSFNKIYSQNKPK